MVTINMEALSILFSLAITLCVETWIYMLLNRSSLKLFLVVSLMNLVSNTSMNIILTIFGTSDLAYWLILSIYEVMTTLVESLVIFLIFKFKYFKTLLVALIANGASFVIGLSLGPLYNNIILVIIFTSLFFLGYIAIYIITMRLYVSRIK